MTLRVGIAAQPLGSALIRFSDITGIQLFFDASLTRGLQSPGVSGQSRHSSPCGTGEGVGVGVGAGCGGGAGFGAGRLGATQADTARNKLRTATRRINTLRRSGLGPNGRSVPALQVSPAARCHHHVASWKMIPSVKRSPARRRLTPWRMLTR